MGEPEIKGIPPAELEVAEEGQEQGDSVSSARVEGRGYFRFNAETKMMEWRSYTAQKCKRVLES